MSVYPSLPTAGVKRPRPPAVDEYATKYGSAFGRQADGLSRAATVTTMTTRAVIKPLPYLSKKNSAAQSHAASVSQRPSMPAILQRACQHDAQAAAFRHAPEQQRSVPVSSPIAATPLVQEAAVSLPKNAKTLRRVPKVVTSLQRPLTAAERAMFQPSRRPPLPTSRQPEVAPRPQPIKPAAKPSPAPLSELLNLANAPKVQFLARVGVAFGEAPCLAPSEEERKALASAHRLKHGVKLVAALQRVATEERREGGNLYAEPHMVDVLVDAGLLGAAMAGQVAR